MAYEIFSDNNPFYSYERGKPPLLRNSTYKDEDLPSLGSDIPLIIQTLIQSLLQKSTSKVEKDLTNLFCLISIFMIYSIIVITLS